MKTATFPRRVCKLEPTFLSLDIVLNSELEAIQSCSDISVLDKSVLGLESVDTDCFSQKVH